MSNTSTTSNANNKLANQQHAVVINEFGEPDVMSYQGGVDIPKLGDNQVLIKVAYAGINPVDYKTRQGKGWGADNIRKDKFADDKPAILGFDVAGEVVSSESEQFTVGDKVAALNFDGGCYAEYVAIDAELLTTVPESVTLKQAGALPCAGQTALQFVEFANIKDGEHVVMNAPAGGVGQLVIQLLMDKVAQNNIKVTVICSPGKYAKLDELIDKSKLAGWIDYTKDDSFSDLQADVLLDLVGDDAGVRALSLLKSDGSVYVLPSVWVDKLKKAGGHKSLSIEGFAVTPSGQSMARVLQQVADGTLKLHIQQSYPLSEVVTAHSELQKGSTFGKIVLEVSA
ncbi:NADP-dependent oxidoreductase [Psychrobacter frigidicola]|uniref:NADP-dependent oxidoreductase n=1 Tax=Psychrobacter frigidicola TaxID=45611 RepID=UPI001919797E|nr:NADP-dependent oxidoreductase [Psychrobacter frigidicola]